MKFASEFRNSEMAKGLIARIARTSKMQARFMEFCGGHTVAIFRYGIRQVLPKTIEMVSGPGCPVCVTATPDIDKALALAEMPSVIITTFGDMLKVPGSRSSLQKARASGADVRMVYSTLDALKIAQENPEKSVVFLGIGFETTAPTVAASVVQAEEQNIRNYYVLSQHKLCPPGHPRHSERRRNQTRWANLPRARFSYHRLKGVGFHRSRIPHPVRCFRLRAAGYPAVRGDAHRPGGEGRSKG